MISARVIGLVGSALSLGSAAPALANGHCDPQPPRQTYYHQQTYRPTYQPTYQRPIQVRDWRQARWNRQHNRYNVYRPTYRY
jgi:hypothetical protein